MILSPLPKTWTIDISINPSGVMPLNNADFIDLARKNIIGISVRSGGDHANVSGITKRSPTTKVLAPDSIINASHISLQHQQTSLLKDFPLEHFVNNSNRDRLFLPLDNLDCGFDVSSSKITINHNDVNTLITGFEETVFELTFYYLDK